MQSRSIDFGFMPQAETLLARVEKFRTTTLDPAAFAWEFTDRGPSVAALREAARLGMTGIEVDRNLGGLGLGFREKVRVAEILSRSSIGFAFSLINTQNVAARLALSGAERHREAFVADLLAGRRFGATALTEPGAGSDFAAITTRAEQVGGGFVLSGHKAWITNAVIADVFLCYAQTDPERGRDGIACFVIDGRRAGFEAAEPYELVSGSIVGVGGFVLDGYEAAEDDMISGPGAGFRVALLGINGARVHVAAMGCAAVRAALGEAVDHGSSRETFGQPILDHQGLAWSLAAVANRLEAAEALTARAVDRHEETQAAIENGDHDDELVRLSALAAAHAKKFVAEMVEPALTTCMQAMGAEGLRAGRAAGRLLSESRILSYVDGTTEMQNERIGRSLVHHYGSSSTAEVSVAARAAERAEPSVYVAPDTSEPAPSAAAEPDDESEQPETVGFVAASGWSAELLSPSPQDAGLFPDPAGEPEDRSSGHDPIDAGSVAPAGAALADATRTLDFEPVGDVGVVQESSAGTPPAPPSEAPTEQLPSVDSPLPGEPPMPPTGPSPAWEPTDAGFPATPPIPPPPPGEPAGFGSPPPPPPTGPPLSTDPALPTDPPLPSVPPLPTTPPMPPGPAEPIEHPSHLSSGPPVPPAEYQQGGSATPTAPPLPGDEHRIEPADDDQPAMPPLPPDSMRTSG